MRSQMPRFPFSNSRRRGTRASLSGSALLTGGIGIAFSGVVALAAAPTTKTPAAPVVKPATAPALDSRAQMEFFEKEVRPVLAAECYTCHGEKVKQGGLRLNTRDFALKGGDKGPSVVPGDPGKSLLIKAINHEGMKMPPGRKLNEKQIASLTRWVQMGAPWPGGTAPQAKAQSWDEIMRTRKQWWSLLPVTRQTVPKVKNAKWSTHPVDLFLLKELEKKTLAPASQADRRTLARRVHLTLTGLPPAPAEVDAFVTDVSPNAYEKLVDRVMASPHYGERWARHWMDVVRYGETHGYEWNHEVRDAWRYRDYLVRAFNQDVPYDQLIREHIAGDLIEKPRRNASDGNANESVVGTTFYRFGEVGHDVFKEIGLDHLDNMIDTTSKAFQATTISCARCHDHKLDAVSTKDYYALLGIFASSRQVIHTVDDKGANAGPKQSLKEIKGQLRGELSTLWKKDAGDAGRYLRAAQAARDKAADAATLAEGLDPARLGVWGKLLEGFEKTKPALEDVFHPWTASVEVTKKGENLSAAWKGLTGRYEQESQTRAEFNRKNFVPWGDFRTGIPESWRGGGQAVNDGPVPAGEFAVVNEGDTILSGIFPAGFYTHVLSEKLNGSFQSPYLPKGKKVSMEVMGGRQGAARFVPDFRLLEDGSSLNGPLAWKRFGINDRDERGYIELATKLDNIRFPGWGGGDKGEPFKDPRSYFGVTRAVIHEVNESPKNELGEARLVATGDADTLDAVAAKYSAAFTAAVEAWAGGKASDDQARLLDRVLRAGLLNNSTKATPAVTTLVMRYRESEKEVQPARTVAGMADLEGFDHPLYKRGDYRTAGDMVPRGYLEVLSASDMRPARGSGRFQLAEEIADPGNPLTSRVMVNRIWHYLFGTGIVRTPDDFGHMGEEPSHPALLDYLATRFTQDGWSVKKMVRYLMTTQAFRMTGQENAKGREVDPENRLIHRFPSRRLEAEVIRDSILAVSGRLDRTLYGPSIEPNRVEPMPERRLFPGPLDGNGRRSIYTRITLMQGPSFLEVFNFPDPKTAMGKRDVTNVPAQALTLLNDPFLIQQSEFWSDRLIKEEDASAGLRIDRMFRTALGRPGNIGEVKRFEKAVQDLATLNDVPPAEVLKSKVVWKDIAHAFFNLKEFIYVK